MSSRYCLITGEALSRDEEAYSRKGLRLLSPRLEHLEALPFTSTELVTEAGRRARKMSIGGVQPKLSAILRPGEARFELVDSRGRYILKPENPLYPELPANEDITMRMAAATGIDTPLHGLIRTKDNQFCYFIRRFDRIKKSGKLAVEDFGQLLGLDRETKYESSMERIASTLQELSSFPVIQNEELFKRVLLMYLTGNEDCHVKNFSILTTEDGVHQLSPAYDMVNTTIVLDTNEELALPLRGKKSRFTREDLVTYFGAERLQLPETIIHQVLSDFTRVQPVWDDLLAHSFLSDRMKQRYTEVLDQRREILNL